MRMGRWMLKQRIRDIYFMSFWKAIGILCIIGSFAWVTVAQTKFEIIIATVLFFGALDFTRVTFKIYKMYLTKGNEM